MGKTTDTELIAKPSRREAKRALRAHHKFRMRTRARRVLSDWGFSPESRERAVLRMADTMKTCSNPQCCGNPRVYQGDSFADKRRKAMFSEED